MSVNTKRCYYEVWDKEEHKMVFCGKKAVDLLWVGGHDVDFRAGGLGGGVPLCAEHLPAVKLAIFNKEKKDDVV